MIIIRSSSSFFQFLWIKKTETIFKSNFHCHLYQNTTITITVITITATTTTTYKSDKIKKKKKTKTFNIFLNILRPLHG